MFRASRDHRGADRWLYPKIWLFVLAASCGLAGIAAHIDWLLTVAIVLLAVAIILKLLSDRAKNREPALDPDEE